MPRFLTLLCTVFATCGGRAVAFAPSLPSQQYRGSTSTVFVVKAVATTMELVDTNHAQFLDVDAGTPVLIDMYAPWCGPCKLIVPVLDRCAEKWESQLHVTKYNIESDNPALRIELALKEMLPRKLPSLVLYQHGKPIATRSGLINDDQLDEFIKANLVKQETTVLSPQKEIGVNSTGKKAGMISLSSSMRDDYALS